MPITSGNLPTNNGSITSLSQQAKSSQKKMSCLSGDRSVTAVPGKSYIKQGAMNIRAAGRLLQDRKVSPYDKETLSRLKQDFSKIRKDNNQRFLTLHEKVKIAKNAKALEPILLEVRNGNSFGTRLSSSQKQSLLEAIELKTLDVLPAVPTEKPSSSKAAPGKYLFSEAQKMSYSQLKDLAKKATGVDALLFFKDIGSGALNTKLKLSAKNEIRLMLMPKITTAQNTANKLFSSLKAKLLQSTSHRQVLEIEKQLLSPFATRFMSMDNLNELRSLSAIAKSRFKS